MVGLEQFFESVFCTQNHTITSTQCTQNFRLVKTEERKLVKIKEPQ